VAGLARRRGAHLVGFALDVTGGHIFGGLLDFAGDGCCWGVLLVYCVRHS
jgi:hypothetical protein